VLQRGQDQGSGGFDSTDDLDHQVNIIAADQCRPIGGEKRRVNARSFALVFAYGYANKF